MSLITDLLVQHLSHFSFNFFSIYLIKIDNILSQAFLIEIQKEPASSLSHFKQPPLHADMQGLQSFPFNA